jgi:hypothetical protein
MRKRFVVSIADQPVAQVNLFQVNFIQKNFGWWHYWNNFWLLTDDSAIWTADTIRENIVKSFPGVLCMVIEIQSNGQDTYAGIIPVESPLDPNDWLLKYWKP